MVIAASSAWKPSRTYSQTRSMSDEGAIVEMHAAHEDALSQSRKYARAKR
jgi:hypothetical protein